jgi:hypothetical protein
MSFVVALLCMLMFEVVMREFSDDGVPYFYLATLLFGVWFYDVKWQDRELRIKELRMKN